MPETARALDIPDDNREDRFLNNLDLYLDPTKAAIEAGYSPSYAKVLIYQRKHSEKLQAKLRNRYKLNAALTLPALTHIEASIAKHLVEEPLEAPKYNHTLKQIKQAAGVLQSDDSHSQPMINVKNAQIFMRESGG